MKKCPKCKRQLRENARFCPVCGTKIEKKTHTKPVLLIIAILLGVIVIGCVGGIFFARLSGERNSNAIKTLNDTDEAVIQNDLEVFSGGDISEITDRVFRQESENIVSAGSDKGVIADLFANADVQVASVTEETITYTIVSPDISDFFQAKAQELQTITTTEELRQALMDYAKTASAKEYTVTLPYTVSEEVGMEVTYDDPAFINAMTGGLLDAYAGLYNQYLEGEG